MATESIDSELPLIVIAGPTASGKTALAIRLAHAFHGEIICADSRTVYTGMDIGTAKPTVEERMTVPHWGLDLVEPNERFTAAQFKQYTIQKIQKIRERGHVPFLVGGTGLYIDAVIFDFQFASEPDVLFRQRLESMSVEELQKYCHNNNILLPHNERNKRYLVREIERNGVNDKRKEAPIAHTYVVGIATHKEVLRTRIEFRTEQLFADNVVNEATMLGKKYGWESEAMKGNIYPLIKQFLDGSINEIELRQRVSFSDWHLARRQMTWFRRNEYVLWADLDEAERVITHVLASKQDL